MPRLLIFVCNCIQTIGIFKHTVYEVNAILPHFGVAVSNLSISILRVCHRLRLMIPIAE